MIKILIAEDDPVSQKLMQRIVSKAGHDVLVSPNGRHAWETMSVTPDIGMLITDVMMPEMDGCELIRHVRASEQWSKLPILIVSAFVGPKAVGEMLDQGATLFLPKPIMPEDLIESMERCLGAGACKKSERSAWMTLTNCARQTTG